LFRILLAEADQEVRVGFMLALERHHYEVLTAASAPEAMRLLNENPVDLLITDSKMAFASGFELAWRAKILRPELLLIYLSGSCSLALLRQAPDGAVLLKPFRPCALKLLIAETLSKLERHVAE
jgi:two-component system, response regulator YesN